MNKGRPVYWHEGVFLRPQHFQQQDDYHDGRLYALASMNRPYAWGVRSLAIAEAALTGQVFEIASCELLFQDGTLIRFPGNARLPGRSLDGLWDPSGKPLSVYVGLRKTAPEGVNVSTEGSAQDREERRYVVSDGETPTRDLYARGEGQPILYLEYKLRLFVEEEAREATDYHLLKIAEVRRFGNDVRLVGGWVPPLVHVGASAHLVRELKDLGEQLTAHGHELAQYKHGKGVDSADLGSRDLLYLLALAALNRWVPRMRQYLATPDVSPWEFYALLRQVVGELSTFSSRYDLFGATGDGGDEEGLPPYRHTDLGTCFAEACRVISRLLEELTAGPDFVVQLHFDGTYYYADVPERIFQGRNRYYLCVRTELEREQVSGVLQTIAKLSSREYLPLLIARALPAVSLQELPTPPNELPRRTGSLYFSVEPHGPAWDAVRENCNAAIYFETLPGEIEVELMVIY
ncbi:MAG: type VI secretion system baseplate subunit TssK, partial [Proteobacteria bacterium]|nr:type VI secretion system baseplate subunit TssK [Pseudomonadota bacterium]